MFLKYEIARPYLEYCLGLVKIQNPNFKFLIVNRNYDRKSPGFIGNLKC